MPHHIAIARYSQVQLPVANLKTELKIKKDVEVDGKQTFCATVDKKNGLEMMGAGRAVNFAETEMRNTSLWDFFLQMLEYDKTKDEAGDKFKKIVLSIFPKSSKNF